VRLVRKGSLMPDSVPGCDTALVTGWWLNEREYVGQEHLDASYVAGYAAKAGYDPAGDVAALKGRSMSSSTVPPPAAAGG